MAGFLILTTLLLQFVCIAHAQECELPALPSNVECYIEAIDDTCSNTNLAPTGKVSPGGSLLVVCNGGLLPKYDAGYTCVYISPTIGAMINPGLGNDACEVGCPDFGSPVFGFRSPEPVTTGLYKVGSVVDLSCTADKTHFGYSALTCQSGGKWYNGNTEVADSDLPPKICFSNCLDPGSPVNGGRVSSSLLHGGSITFECNLGNLVGHATIYCNDGVWSNSVPSCGNCILPYLSLNVVCYTRSPDETCGSTSLAAGHAVLLRGPEDPPSFLLVCDEGYLPKHDTGHRCVTGNVINPSLGDDVCEVGCPDFGNPDSGLRLPLPIIGGIYKIGSILELSCAEDKTHNGFNTLTCQSDGKWYNNGTKVDDSDLPPKICFSNCVKPRNPANGHRLGENTKHGENIWFECDTGHRLKGERTIYCNDGVWNASVPSCENLDGDTTTNAPSSKGHSKGGSATRVGTTYTDKVLQLIIYINIMLISTQS
ncbi:CUB and sushi domain-containing protein 3-like [Glandiceps talaboti]